MHFYGIDLADTLSQRSRRRFSALSMLVVVRRKNGPHSLKQNSLFYLPPLCKQVLSFAVTDTSCSISVIKKVLLK